MTDSDVLLYRRAALDAVAIMGTYKPHPRAPRMHFADEDPLAWWCLTELLVAYASGAKGRPSWYGEKTT